MSGDEPPVGVERSGPASGNRRRYLFTVDMENAQAVLPLVCDVVADADGDLIIGKPVVLPDQTPLSAPEPRQEADRQVAGIALKAKEQCPAIQSVGQAVNVGHKRESVVRQLIEQNDISTVITGDRPDSGIRSLLRAVGVDDSSLEASCDTILVTRVNRAEDIDSILVPVARGPHSGMAVDVGLAVARQNDASLELLHVSPTGDHEAKANGEAVLDHASDRIDSYEGAEVTLREVEEVAEAIIEYTNSFDLAVLGAPREGLIRQFVLGTIPDTVSAKADETVLVAHRGNVDESWLDRWLG